MTSQPPGHPGNVGSHGHLDGDGSVELLQVGSAAFRCGDC
jgi:hypothetical protein